MPPHGNENASSHAHHTFGTSETFAKNNKLPTPTAPNRPFIELCVDGESSTNLRSTRSEPQHLKAANSSLNKSILKSDSSKRNNKTVKFKNAQIRTFPQVLGDHPCCSTGLPISLAWMHSSEHTISIDAHEQIKMNSPRRSRRELRLNDSRRREILQMQKTSITASESPSSMPLSSGTTGNYIITTPHIYSKEELRRTERKLSRQRQQRQSSRRRSLVNQFFAPPVKVE